MEFEDDIDALYATYQSLLPMAEADSARLWQKFRLDWNYNSNRIEGNTLTRGETKALLEEGIKPIKMRKDILQMQSHDKAIDVLRELADSNTPLTEADIRALHKTALGENYWTEAITAENVITKREIEIGVYKKVPNIVLKSDGSTHEYASPQEVPARMEATIKRLRKYLKKPDVPLYDYLAELHQDFIQTHPFDDGNGRVVRLLINYVCLHLGWPPLIIKSDKRSEYIASLESWNDGDERPFRELMKRELIWSVNKSIAAARGEDIDDDGDLDKEIDLFVREAKMSADEYSNVQSSKLQYSNECFLLIAEQLNFYFQKLSPLFEVYNSYPTISNFMDETVFIGNFENQDRNIQQTLILDKWIGPTEYQIKLKTILVNKGSEPLISSEIEVWKNQRLGPQRLFSPLNKSNVDGKFRFQYDYSQKPSKTDTKGYSDSIGKAILEEVKLFSQSSP